AGTLLEDIAAGMSFEAVKARFAAKMRPDVYQRPQAAPAAGNIRRAEQIVEALGIAASLPRRYARVDELRDKALWLPRPKTAAPAGGVFGHLTPRAATPTTSLVAKVPPMTWEK